MDETLAAKVISLVVLFVGTVTFGLLPLILGILLNRMASPDDSHTRMNKFLSALNYVAGGVFLGTVLLHLVPDVRSGMVQAITDSGGHMTYPFPELTIALGLLAFLTLEQIVLSCKGCCGQEYVTLDQIFKPQTEKSHLVCDQDGECLEGSGRYGTVSTVDKHDHIDHENESSLTVGVKDVDIDKNEHEHTQTRLILRSYALVVALSLHSIFEGIVVGLQDNADLVWGLFAAIILHKCLVAFSLGSKLYKMKQVICLRHIIGLVCAFSIMSPIGGTVGTLLSVRDEAYQGGLVQPILTGVATGSFMYVTFFEMLKFEDKEGNNLLTCVLIMLGFGIIAGLEVLMASHHHH